MQSSKGITTGEPLQGLQRFWFEENREMKLQRQAGTRACSALDIRPRGCSLRERLGSQRTRRGEGQGQLGGWGRMY